jgi:hypothetical protein
MRDLVVFFREGGYGMYVVLALGVAALTAGIAYVVDRDRPLRPVCAGLLIGTVAAGIVFTQLARGRVEAAIAGIEPGPQKLEILEMGKKEAGRNLELALGAALIAAIPFGAAELKRRRG